jgi:aspartyl-tRNA(Asn)/glutamyl-tRNA(Gln) amidotransferase subunit A
VIAPAERLAAARAAIRDHADLHAFISLSTERFQPPGEDGQDRAGGPIVAVKDLIDVSGLPTTGGSLGCGSVSIDSDAPVVKRVRDAGGIVIGKTNLYEWAFGVTGHNPHYGDVVNPHDLQRTAGGSSGGSAVAVAAGMCDWAIGTDTGGSIRIPASLCGVVGIKPTRGLLSTEGVLPLSGSLDTVGPLARDVPTATGALEILIGRALPLIEDLVPRLAVPRGWVEEGGVEEGGVEEGGLEAGRLARGGWHSGGLDADTRAVWRSVAHGLPAVDFPALERLSVAARTVLEWEAAAVHEAHLRAAPDSYGQEVRERLERVMSEKRSSSEEVYRSALYEMSELSAQVESALEGWDAVLLPASACVAPLHRERDVREPLIRFMRPFNLTGHPAIVLPAPTPGLPVGVQLVGRLGSEALLVSVALALERSWATPKSRTDPDKPTDGVPG